MLVRLISCNLTSVFRKREYPGVSLGSESGYMDYLRSLASLFMEVHRI